MADQVSTRYRGNKVAGQKGATADTQEIYETDAEKRAREERDTADKARQAAFDKKTKAAGGGLGGAGRAAVAERTGAAPAGPPKPADYASTAEFDAAMKKWNQRTAADAATALGSRTKN